VEIPTHMLMRYRQCLGAMDFSKAIQNLDNMHRQVALFFENFHVLLSPVLAKPPLKVGLYKPHFLQNRLIEFADYFRVKGLMKSIAYKISNLMFAFHPYTPLHNVCGQPAMSVPLFWTEAGLPMGVQFASSIGDDALLLQLASQLEQVRPWFDRYANL